MIKFIPLILFSVLLNAIAQLVLKKGMGSLGEGNLILKIIINPYIIAGMGIYGISILSWLFVLSKVNVSVAYPFLSIGFIFSSIAAYYVFNEPLTIHKIIGIALICAGLVFLSLSRG